MSRFLRHLCVFAFASSLAVVFDGRCLVAPTVRAVLSGTFVITGLDGRAEAERLAQALSPAPKN